MKVYSLSGKSGTGKSYNALELCARLHIDAIVDDGLFICGGSILAGISAKKQPTKIGAIKTALFKDDAHCAAVSAAIKEENPESILVLGTSDEMTRIIAERLGLEEPSEYIHIEEITTRVQREIAKELRNRSGMHVIPAPTFQVKKQFSGYFLDAKKNFRSEDESGTKTIVRPTYSYLGKYEISDKVITDLVGHVVQKIPGASYLIWAGCSMEDDGIFVRIILFAEWGSKAKSVALAVQKEAAAEIAMMTAFNILGVEVEIRGFRMKK